MKISLVIPTRRVDEQMLSDCIGSMEGMYDELIVYDKLMDNLSQKINEAVKLAHGEYIVVSNDDLTLIQGDLDRLCWDYPSAPAVKQGFMKTFHGHMWCCKRDLFWEVGGMDEGYNEGPYYMDADLCVAFIKKGYPPTLEGRVVIDHGHPATTIKTTTWDKGSQKNRDLFLSKWGEEGLGLASCT